MDPSSYDFLFCLAQFPSSQEIVAHGEQCRAHPLETAQIWIDGTQLISKLRHTETVLNPGGEIALFVFQAMPRFEDMEIDGTHFDFTQRVPKFLECPYFHTSRDLQNERLIKVERFAKNDSRDYRSLRQMVVNNGDQFTS